MKAFVTGAAGFLGRHIVDTLQREGFDVVTIVRPTSDVRHLRERNVRLIEGDLRDQECIVAATKGADVIVHAAATLRGKLEDFQEINVDSTRVLLEQAVKESVKRFVFISSIIVYDHSTASAWHTFSEEMAYESAQQTYYSETKIEAEKLVSAYRQKHDLATVILRPGALYGKRGPLFLSRLGMAAGNHRYLIIGNGNLPLPLSHVEGVAKAVSLSIEKREAVGKVYNVIEDESLSQKEFFDDVREFVVPRFSTLRLPFKFVRFLGLLADKVLGLVKMKSPLSLSYLRLCATPFYYCNKKIKSDLGWPPEQNFRQSIRDMMLWHREQKQPKRNPPENKTKVDIASTQKLRVGIVGCGVISGPHAEALGRLKNTVIAAVSDPVREARESVARKYRVSGTYSDYREMLDKEDLDAVHVCTPAQTHAQVSIDAMTKGCHVFVEKPMAMNTAEAKKMVAAAHKKKVKLCVDHNHLYDSVMVKARTLIASGAIGRVSYVESWYGTSYSSDTGSRYLTWEGRRNWAYDLPGTLYQNFISHPISLLLDVMGEAQIENVQAKYNRIVPHMSTDELLVRLESESMLGTLSLSMAVSPRYLFLNVYGTGGTMRIDFLNRYLFIDKPVAKLPRVLSRSAMAIKHSKSLFGAAVRNSFVGLIGKYNLYQGNETLIRLFYKSILDDEPLPISPEEGVRSMELMDEIWTKLPLKNGLAAAKKISKNGTNRKTVRSRAKKPKQTLVAQ